MQALTETPREVAPEPSPEDLAVLDGGTSRWRWWAGAGVVAALLLTGGIVWFSSGSTTEWETETAFAGTLSTRVTAVGQLEPSSPRCSSTRTT